MQILEWYRDVLQKYALFRGRARRQEFWFYLLATVVIVSAYSITTGGLLAWLQGEWLVAGSIDVGWYQYFGDTFNLIGQFYTLAVVLPSLAVTARRLHDTGRSGWWLLLIAIPIVGWTVLFTLCSIDGDPGRNRYGPSPKHEFGASEDPLTTDPLTA